MPTAEELEDEILRKAGVTWPPRRAPILPAGRDWMSFVVAGVTMIAIVGAYQIVGNGLFLGNDYACNGVLVVAGLIGLAVARFDMYRVFMDEMRHWERGHPPFCQPAWRTSISLPCFFAGMLGVAGVIYSLTGLWFLH